MLLCVCRSQHCRRSTRRPTPCWTAWAAMLTTLWGTSMLTPKFFHPGVTASLLCTAETRNICMYPDYVCLGSDYLGGFSSNLCQDTNYHDLWLLWCPPVPPGRQALKLSFPSFPVHNSVLSYHLMYNLNTLRTGNLNNLNHPPDRRF
jgi:hypothetical protein